jgi:hypothetical protein
MSDYKYHKGTQTNLYEVRHFLRETTRRELGVYLEDVFAYVQDPWVAQALGEAGHPAFSNRMGAF